MITAADHQEDIMIDLQEDTNKEEDRDNKEEDKDNKEEDKIDLNIETIEEIEITTDHQEENTIETSIEEETTDKTIDHQEDNNKDTNQEERNSEKESQSNGLKLTKSVQEMTESTLSLKLSQNNSFKEKELC